MLDIVFVRYIVFEYIQPCVSDSGFLDMTSIDHRRHRTGHMVYFKFLYYRSRWIRVFINNSKIRTRCSLNVQVTGI